MTKTGGGLCDKDFKSTTSAKQNLNSTTSLNQNSNSTTSALTKKTKQNLASSRLTNKRFSLKKFILLLFKLYEIKRSHKRTQRLYKDYIFLYPHLKYEKLELCTDYKEALKLKFHLSFLLGQALIKASKTWYKGGFFKLYSLIKEANKIFKEFKAYENEVDSFVLALIFENQAQILLKDKNLKEALIDLLNSLNLNQKEAFVRNLLKFVENLDFTLNLNSSLSQNSNKNLNSSLNQTLNSKQNPIQQAFQNESFRKDLGLFLKDFLDLLKTFKDYEALNESLKHNLSFNFTFLYENLSSIKTWLSSSEFKEKFHNQNHPYPSLLNPDKIEYESINAELAWDLNLALPDRYSFFAFALHTSGEQAFVSFLKQCNKNLRVLVGAGAEGACRYATLYKWLLQEELIKIIVMLDSRCNDFKKLLFLMRERPCVLLTRDPIDRLKSFLNVRHLDDGWHSNVLNIAFNKRNFDEINDRIVYAHSDGYFKPKLKLKSPEMESNLKALSDFKHPMLSYILKLSPVFECFKEQNIYCFDTKDLIGAKLYPSLKKLAEIGNYELDSTQILAKQLYSNITILLPVCIQVGEAEIYISNRSSTKSLPSTKDTLDLTSEFELAKDEVFDSNLCIFVQKEDFIKLKDEKNDYKAYLKDFLSSLKDRILKENKKMFKSEQVLDFLKKDKQTSLKLKSIFDKEYAHLKKTRPDIVASWKYYAEFEKMCEEFK